MTRRTLVASGMAALVLVSVGAAASPAPAAKAKPAAPAASTPGLVRRYRRLRTCRPRGDGGTEPLAQLRFGGGRASAAPDRQRAGRRARASNAIRSVTESAAVPLA